MSAAFADTSFYIALLSPNDRFHSLARETSASLRGETVTTEYVLVELGNYFGTVSRAGFMNFVHVLRQDARTRILSSSPHLFEEGLTLYGQRQDKGWSLTDCISFAIMRKEGLSSALTLDNHFGQAGFEILLKR